jgi:hypothetical protein
VCVCVCVCVRVRLSVFQHYFGCRLSYSKFVQEIFMARRSVQDAS